jgi:hypothetical protein
MCQEQSTRNSRRSSIKQIRNAIPHRRRSSAKDVVETIVLDPLSAASSSYGVESSAFSSSSTNIMSGGPRGVLDSFQDDDQQDLLKNEALKGVMIHCLVVSVYMICMFGKEIFAK